MPSKVFVWKQCSIGYMFTVTLFSIAFFFRAFLQLFPVLHDSLTIICCSLGYSCHEGSTCRVRVPRMRRLPFSANLTLVTPSGTLEPKLSTLSIPLHCCVSAIVRPLMLKGVVFCTAESGGCLLHSGPGDQAIQTEKTQQRRRDTKVHQA